MLYLLEGYSFVERVLGVVALLAVAALARALGNPDLLVRKTATNSLNKVSPQILGRILATVLKHAK